MKRITFLAVVSIALLAQLKAETIEGYLTGSYGSIFAIGEEEYQNSMTRIWNINTGVSNKPVLIECNMDTEDGADVLYIYAVDSSGKEYLVASRTGVVSSEYISTNLPTGKAKVVFRTDNVICGDPNEGNYFGVESYFEVDNSYTGTVANVSYIRNSTIENSIVLNKLAVGTNSAPDKRVEIWDGASARFTFSGNTTTSGYEVAQIIDNTGYKLNVANSSRNYRVALNGTDHFKLLTNFNYALGANAMNSVSTGTNNIAFGQYALYANTTGTYNIGIGYQAGRYIANGSTANQTAARSIFIGSNTKSSAAGQSNEIVIGYNAVGAGSNSVMLGSDAVTKTILKGNVGIGTAAPAQMLDIECNADYQLRLGNAAGGGYNIGRNRSTGYLTFYGGQSGLSGYVFDGTIKSETLVTNDYVQIGNATVPQNSFGKKLYFGLTAENTDDLWIARFNRGSNQSDIRVNLGDDNIGDDRFIIGTTTGSGYNSLMIVANNGNAYLNGNFNAHKVTIETETWADFVFKDDYRLPTLTEVKNHIETNKHLPDIPTEKEVKENGVNLGEMQIKLLQKIEELTLYIIDLETRIHQLETK